MANWAWNHVSFSGSKEKIDSLKKIFEEMIQRYKKLGKGVLPIFQEKAFDGYYFDLHIHDYFDEGIIVTYSTKWSSNFRDCAYLCSKLDIDCEGTSEESGNNYYERFICKGKKAGNIILSDSDIDLHKYYINDDISIDDIENRIGPVSSLSEEEKEKLDNDEENEWYTDIDNDELSTYAESLDIELE